MQAQITQYLPHETNDCYDRIEFVLDNGDDVGFVCSITVAHACYLSEHEFTTSSSGPYVEMIEFIANSERETLIQAAKDQKEFTD